MVSMALAKRLAALEDKAKPAGQQSEVVAILRQRAADPTLSDHRREVCRMILEVTHLKNEVSQWLA